MGYAAALALWQRRTPTRLLGNRLQCSTGAHVVGQELHAEFYGVFAGSESELIHKALYGKGVGGVLYRAPGGYGDGKVGQILVDSKVGDVVGRIAHYRPTAFDAPKAVLVDSILHDIGTQTSAYGAAGNLMEPPDHLRLSVETGFDPVTDGGAKLIVLYIVFPRPDDLDWSSNGFRCYDGFRHEVGVASPAEPAPEKRGMDKDLIRREP